MTDHERTMQAAGAGLVAEIAALRSLLARLLADTERDGDPRTLAGPAARLVDSIVRAQRAQQQLGAGGEGLLALADAVLREPEEEVAS